VTVKRWLIEKIVLSVLAFCFFYMAGSALNVVPQSMKDSVAWFAENFQAMAVSVCFIVACYTAIRILNRKKQEGSAK